MTLPRAEALNFAVQCFVTVALLAFAPWPVALIAAISMVAVRLRWR